MSKKPIQQGLMGLLAVLMVAGMAYQFTPALNGGGSLFGQKQQGTPAVKVGSQTLTVEELQGMRSSNQLLAANQTGLLGDDFKLYTVTQGIQQKLLTEASKDQEVSRADVNAEVDKIREANNLKDNKAWTDALQGIGQTDSSFRQRTRDQLAIKKKVEAMQAATPAASEAELRAYYDLHKDEFKSDAQIVGREIVVADKAKADDLHKQLLGGADFAKLASANSLENKDRGGALAAIENGAPKPVSAVVLPTDVSAAAFALTSGGLTDVIPSGGRFYIVKVERFVAAAPKTFEASKTQLTTTVDKLKKDAALEAWMDGLKKNTQVEYVDPEWKVSDPTVASVNGQNIPYSDVVAQVVNNQQVAQMFGQLPPEQLVGMLNTGLKPGIVKQLLESYAAPAIAKNLGLNIVGSRAAVAQALAAYGAKDVKVTDADLQAAYQKNLEQYKTPASATVDEAVFKDKGQADAFRADWNGQGDFTTSASKAGGTVSERGAVNSGAQGIDPALDAQVFGNNLRAVGEGSLTPVVKVGERYSVAYVRDLKKATTKTFAEVRAQLEPQVLAEKQASASQAFMEKQLATLKPVDNLEKVLAEQAKRVTAAEKAAAPSTTPGTATPGATTPGNAETTPADK